MVLHQLNPVFHDAKSLRETTGVPVLGVVSMTWLERSETRRKVDLSSFAAASIFLLVALVLVAALGDTVVEFLRGTKMTATG